MARNINNRLSLYKKEIVDSNREFDYINSTEIDLGAFEVQEFQYIVTQAVVNRIDLISREVYGTVNLWWLIALRNDLINVMEDMQVGQTLYIPSISEYYKFYNKTVKAQPDTEEYSFNRRTL